MNPGQRVTYVLTIFFLALTVAVICFMGFYAKRKLDAFEDQNPEVTEEKANDGVSQFPARIGPQLQDKVLSENFGNMKQNLEQIDEVEDESASKYEQHGSVRTVKHSGISAPKISSQPTKLAKDDHSNVDLAKSSLEKNEKNFQITPSMGALPEILETEERGIIETEPEEQHINTIQKNSDLNKTSLHQSKKRTPESVDRTELASTALASKNEGLQTKGKDLEADVSEAQIKVLKSNGPASKDIYRTNIDATHPQQAIQTITISESDKKIDQPPKLTLDISVQEFVNDEECKEDKQEDLEKKLAASNKDSCSEIREDEAARSVFEYLSRPKTMEHIIHQNIEQARKKETVP